MKCSNVESALFYVRETIENNWSRAVLLHQIESRLYERQGKSIQNFKLSLPSPQADLAREILKNPYNFDFLTLGKEAICLRLKNWSKS
jgi:predicted nuclease of restriction endonuclease-like (RecB) superfamily